MPTKTFYRLGQDNNQSRPEVPSGSTDALPVAVLRSGLKGLLPKNNLKPVSIKSQAQEIRHESIQIPDKDEFVEAIDQVKNKVKNAEEKVVHFFAGFRKSLVVKADEIPDQVWDDTKVKGGTKIQGETNVPLSRGQAEGLGVVGLERDSSVAASLPRHESQHQSFRQVEPQFLQSMVLDTANKIELKYRKLIIGLLSLFVLLIVINLYTVFYLNFSNQTTPVVSAQTQALTPNLQQIKSPEVGLKIVREFAGNNALADIGFQLSVAKNEIKTKGSPNCKTPILPPMENGCHFLLIPSALGVPNRGTIYRSLGVDATLAEGDKIEISIKNYEKDQIQTITTINSTNITQDFTLPENIPTNSGILFRLWAKNQDISIRQINVRYFSVDDLKQVAGTLDGDLAKIEEVPKIYYDANQNGKLDKDTDLDWACRPNFPGAKMNIASDGKFVIEPDDGCFVDVKPDCWYKTKVNKCALPNGKWLVAYESKPIVIPFEIEDNVEDLSLEAR